MEEKLTLTDFVYICSLSDLGRTRRRTGSFMLKLDVVAGQYELKEYLSGYVIAKVGYNPDLKDVAKIFNDRDSDKGLSGTYHDGETKDENHMRLLNDCIRFHLHEEYVSYIRSKYEEEDESDEEWELQWNREYYSSEEDSGTEMDLAIRPIPDAPIEKLQELPAYHNLPILFYLNQSVNENDLDQISLKFPINKKFGNVQAVWRVVHDQYGDIGMAVLQKQLYDMMGDQAGLAFFATTSANAFGNFDYYKLEMQSSVELFANEWVSYPRYEFNCKSNPCSCDYRYPPRIVRVIPM